MHRPHTLPWYTVSLVLVALFLSVACSRGGPSSPGPGALTPQPSLPPGERGGTALADAGPGEPERDSSPPSAIRSGPVREAQRQPQSTFGYRIRGRSELGGSWERFQPCEGLASQRCEGSAVPRLAPDLQLGVVAGGTLLDRVHIAVDYDGTREFDAANDLRVFFEGRAGEFLRRFEAGNVQLSLPASRFLNHAVPLGHWGFRAVSQAGPIELQALWAQGGGQLATREFRLPAGGTGVVREAGSAWDDAQYAGGQFFFLLDPALVRGHPHLDILALSAADGPPGLVPAAGVRLYRYEGGPPARDGSTTVLTAAPADPARHAEALSAPFRLLQHGVDYQLHRSGLWLILKQPLRDEEALGVAYRSVTGAEVGSDVPASPGATPEIRLLRGPRAAHLPGASTWPLEMRHVYRVSGSDDLEPGSLRLTISRGEIANGDLGRPHPSSGAVIPYLQLFGLDDDHPREILDATRVYRPASETLEPAVAGVFVVFPTLQPFAAPPPVRSLGLSAAAAALVLGEAANLALYAAADERSRAAAARFRLGFRFTTRGTSASSIPLGAIGIREGSEQVYLGNRLLRRGTDYEILYETGQLELLAPSAVLGGAGAELRVTFEQLPLFAAAPTRIAGLSARIPIGSRGELNLIGLSQQERSLVRRATLGMEPASLLFGGASGSLRWSVPWLDRVFEERGKRNEEREDGEDGAMGRWGGGVVQIRDPTSRNSAFRIPHSEVRLGGEVAVSLPDPGGDGAAYLDDFEDRGELVVPLQRSAWRLGSAPASRQGADAVLPQPLSMQNAAALVWQHDYQAANGRTVGSLALSAIDRRIRVAGSSLEPNVLYLSLHAGAPRGWRSITTVLSPTGRDLRSYEYLEVYVAGAASGEALVLDLGTVSEDAFAFDAEGRTGGSDAAGRSWGLGVLDREWDPSRESWTTASDRGLWNAACQGEPRAVYPLGDVRANCTRGNGLPDTEDLNGNGVLDTDERVFRYLLRPADSGSPYLAADTLETGTGFRLFRIPLDRGAGVGAPPDEIRQVRHLRLTAVGGPGTQLTLARLRLVGSRWEKRSESGVLGGLVSASRPASALARVEVGPVSRLSAGAAYVSPPGVTDAPRDAAALGAQTGTEYNEQSLRIRYRGLGEDERAEVYRRYEGGPQNFLAYRQLRLWALARDGAWGSGGEALVVRVGNDPDNHYLYRQRLTRVGAPSTGQDWGAEIVIEFERWIALRAEAERLLAGRPAVALEPRVVWDADSTYAVVLAERGRAPNLAAVREISLGVWNGGTGLVDGEVWIDELRLAAAERRPGVASTVTLGVRGANVVEAELTVMRRSGHFRELSAAPSFLGEDALSLRAGLQLGRLLPARWGLEAPLSVSLERSGSAPVFVDGTDLEARSLPGLRQLGAARSSVHLQLRRGQPSRRPWTRATLDGLALQLALSRTADDGAFSSAHRSETNAGFSYEARPPPRTLPLLPGGLMPWQWLSSRVGAEENRRGGPQLRWSPVHFSFGTVWSDGASRHQRFGGLLDGADAAAAPELGAVRSLVHRASLSLQPLESLTGAAQLRSTSDLLPAARRGPGAAASLEAERLRLGGLDLGRESQRDLATQLSWAPKLSSWLTMRSTLNNTFALDANPAYLGLSGPVGDTALAALRSFGNRRSLAVRWGVDARALARVAGLPDSATAAGWARGAEALARSVRRLELGWGETLESRYDRVAAHPELGYQLALGGRSSFAGVSPGGPSLLADRTHWSARAQLELPGAVGITLSFADAVGLQAGPRGERADHTREWPGILARWSGVPFPSLLGNLMRNAALATGYALQSQRWDERGTGQVRSQRTVRFPLDLSLQWQGGFSTAYRGEWRLREVAGPLASTEQSSADHAASVGGAFAVPDVLSALFPAPLAVSLRYAHGEERECRLSMELTVCLPGSEFAGYRSRAWGLQLDTRASGMNVGLQFEHRDRLSRASDLSGSRQFTLSLFGQFNLSAGTIP
jgi:hypothetical protein